MPFFFVRLLPNRAGFPANLTADEGAVMQAHGAFLREQLAEGTLVAAGPVVATTGTFGMAVFEVESREALDALLAKDPAQAIGSYEVSSMPSAVARGR